MKLNPGIDHREELVLFALVQDIDTTNENDLMYRTSRSVYGIGRGPGTGPTPQIAFAQGGRRGVGMRSSFP